MRRKIGATDRIVVGGKSSTVGEYLAAHPGPRRQVLRGLLTALKSGHANIAWDESKHPRDDHGRFADKPDDAASERVLLHGTNSDIAGNELRPSARGRFGPGVYLTEQPSVAARYGAKTLHFAVRGQLFRASKRIDAGAEDKIIEQLNPDERVRLADLKNWYKDDGEAFWEALRRSTKGDERATQAIRSAGFVGIEGIGDGHEVLIFDPKNARRVS